MSITKPNILQLSNAPTGSGGGVSGLTPNQLLFGGVSGSIQQTSSLNFNTSSNTIYNEIISENISGDSIVFVGDSITNGGYSGTYPYSSATIVDNTQRFSALICNRMGLTETNLGVFGARISSMPGQLPTKTSTQRFLVIAFGVNDIKTPGYTTASASFVGGLSVSGSSAVASASISGGGVHLTLISSGSGYVTIPTISITGDGTGSVWTVNSINIVEGIEIYNTTTHTKNFFNGSSWRQITDAAA